MPENDYTSFDCNKVLGVNHDASPQEIKKAWFTKSKACHPDMGGTNDQQVRINLAYEILRNPIEREKHDRYWDSIYFTRSGNTTYTKQHVSNSRTTRVENDRPNTSSRKSSIQQLFVRVTTIAEEELTILRAKQNGWVSSKKYEYEKQYNNWKEEQERVFKKKVASYESELNQKRQQEEIVFNKKVDKYTLRYLSKVKQRRFSFSAAVILSETSIILLGILVTSITFSLDWIYRLSVLFSSAGGASAAICWIWWLTTRRLSIVGKCVYINDIEWKTKIRHILQDNRHQQWLMINGHKVAIQDLDCMSKVISILRNDLFLHTTTIGASQIPYKSDDWHQIIFSLVNQEWKDLYSKQEEASKQKKAKYLRYVAEISDLVERTSTFDISEEQVARRIAATFFLMGYFPVHYDNPSRMLIYSDGDENIAIRFRHRTGSPTNIAYVKRMVNDMVVNHAHQGFLFCTPGLSDNASNYSQANSIKWYSLETMNEWIDNVLSSGYSGPPGDILRHVESMYYFLSRISVALPSRH